MTVRLQLCSLARPVTRAQLVMCSYTRELDIQPRGVQGCDACLDYQPGVHLYRVEDLVQLDPKTHAPVFIPRYVWRCAKHETRWFEEPGGGDSAERIAAQLEAGLLHAAKLAGVTVRRAGADLTVGTPVVLAPDGTVRAAGTLEVSVAKGPPPRA